MKKVININFQGRVIPIEETAYEILKQYVDSLRRYFINEEGREEIINDIESRIAELFGETLKKGGICITDEDVNAVINSIGRPEDFDGDEEKVKSRVYEESGNNKNYTYTKAERFYRSENDKIIAGVCGGLAAYFGIDPIIVRVLFVVFSFGFGFGFIAYIVLWIAVPSTASTVIGSARKRLLRDPEDKLIGGVCKGLSYYFGVNVWIPRVLFLIPFFSFFFKWAHWGALGYPNFLSVSFSPGATLIYIILWIVLPEAKSSSDRLEMKGEKVDINSIKNNITNEMKGVGERVTKFSKEATVFATETSKQFTSKSKQWSSEVSQTARRSGHGVGNVFALLIKIFVYFIVGSILFAIVCGLFALGVVMIGLLPLKNYIVNNGWETIFAWGTLLLIWIPVISIITTVIRRLAKMKRNSGILRISFLSLWLLGLACGIGLLVSLVSDFRYRSTVNEQNIALSDAKTNKLELHADRLGSYYRRYDWLQMEPFANIDEDTAYVNNLHVRIVKADADSFEVKLLKMSDGASREQANELSNEINYN
ncbi:MAG: PspC domain-containing protein, partial [Bacteroidota bacterium]|nr:PspC domain-containing protein [Bacteroidota bacterium]